MRRYQLVIGGTIAGVAAVLAFPTKSTHLTIPSAAAAGASSSTSSSSTSGGSTSGGSTTSGAAGNSGTSPTTGGSSASPGGSATRSATSDDQSFRYGDMEVTVTVEGTKITNIAMAALNETDGRSASIDSYAIPQLEQQVISADSVNINGVSGATFTSQAFVDGVANALGKLGIKG